MAGVASGLDIGSTFRGYRIESVIGHGGMGAVYLATHLRLERKVALKVLLPELATDESFRERFLLESQLAASLEHPNIVPVYDADEEDGALYLVMRFIQGEDLGSIIRREGALDSKFVVTMIDQAASALDTAHESGLVHRDVKPANILVSEGRKHVYLTDFGVAKRMRSMGLTRTGFFVGTVDYCAPEQIEGKEIDGRADIYALGGVLFHCLAGRRPYEKDTDVAVITAHLLEPPPAITEIQEHLSPALDAVILTAMAKRPDDRYQSAGDLAEAARAAMTDAPAAATVAPTDGSASRAATLTSTGVAVAGSADGAAGAETLLEGTAPATAAAAAAATEAPGAPTAPATQPSAPSKRRFKLSRRMLVIGGIVLLGVVAAIAAVVLLSGGSSKKTTNPPPPPPPPSGGGIVPSFTRPWLASASGSLYVTGPQGSVTQLDPATLDPVSSIPDPTHPRAMAASGSRIVTADDRTVTAYRTPGFTPVGAAPFGPRPMLGAGAANAPIAIARPVGGSGGRICVVNAASTDPAKMLDPCVTTVGFAPAGLGVASGGRIFVADAKGGKVQLLTASGGQLVAGDEHDAGTSPAGRLIASGSHLYVPVAGGVAVLDLDSGSHQRTIALPARPSDIWVTSSGRLFAALPTLGKVAVIPLAASASKHTLVAVSKHVSSLGGGPLPSGGEAVYAADLSDGTVSRLDPSTGKVIVSKRVGALTAKTPAPLKVTDVTFSSAGQKVNAVIHLAGGALPQSSLVTKSADIKGGAAALALWEAGILSNVHLKQGHGLAISIQPKAGRLLVSAKAKPGAFAHLDVTLGKDGKSVLLAFTKVPTKSSPPPPVSPQPSPTPPPSPSPSPSPPPSPAPSPTPPPPPPPPTIG
jgi:serine/threonine-protein kinase